MNTTSTPALKKALEINLDTKIYGTFAEIGAGQEVARFFFQAGKASQTVAKTMSAYDMVFSDEIYGREAHGRYVCESRLLKMLNKEFGLLQKRLSNTRGSNTTFFALADTVSTGDAKRKISNGWMGIRFQKKPNGPTNDILLHVRLLDDYRLLQQEALGILGVNLVYAAFRAEANYKSIVDTLTDGIRKGQIAIDYLKCTGPDMENVNEALANLEVLRKGFGEAVMFSGDGQIQSLSDAVFDRPLIIERGTFKKAVSDTQLDLIQRGRTRMLTDFASVLGKKEDPLPIFEMTLKNLTGADRIQDADFLKRLKFITATGMPVIVSDFTLFYRLKKYLRQYTRKPLGLIISAQFLPKLFDETHYQDLDGGLLEGLGKLLDANTRIYVDPQASKNAQNFDAPAGISDIYKHFLGHHQILDF